MSCSTCHCHPLYANATPRLLASSSSLPIHGKFLIFHILWVIIFASFPALAHSCVLGWGRNANGEMNAGFRRDVNHPVPVHFPALYNHTVSQIVSGSAHSIAIDHEGRSFGFGINARGCCGVGYEGGELDTPLPILERDLFNGKKIVRAFAGHQKTFLLASDGSVYHFGANDWNDFGPLSLSLPTPFPFNQTHRVKHISISMAASLGTDQFVHQLLLTEEGQVWAWGKGQFGQLGTREDNDEITPVLISGNGALIGTVVTKISSGTTHSLALSEDGQVSSWGSNQLGQLGLGATYTSTNIPTALNMSIGALDSKTAVDVIACASTSFIITQDGSLFAFGNAHAGQSGVLPLMEKIWEATQVFSEGVLKNRRIVQVSCGIVHTVALTLDSVAVSWGQNVFGQCGVGHLSAVQVIPALVDTTGAVQGEPIVQVSARALSTIILSASGQMFFFGLKNYNALETSQIELTTSLYSPDPVNTQQNPVDSMCATSHYLYTTPSGALLSSGRGSEMQCGDGSPFSRVDIHPTLHTDENIFDVSCGSLHSLALTSSGSVLSFGSNLNGRIGVGRVVDSQSGVSQIAIPPRMRYKTIVKVDAGDEHSMLLDSDGSVWGFGKNIHGALGMGHNRDIYVAQEVDSSGVLEGVTIADVVCGGYHTLFLSSDGNAFSVGYNVQGGLGIGNFDSQTLPVAVQMPSSGGHVIHMAAGSLHSLFLTAQGIVWGCGGNFFGQIGLSIDVQPIPQPLENGHLKGMFITQIAAGALHSLFLSSVDNITLIAVGDNRYMQLGTGVTDSFSKIPRSVNLPKSDDQGEARIVAGSANSYLITCAQIKCFGVNHLHPLVCSHHGTCTKQDKCECNSEYTGPNCEFAFCGEFPANDSRVCSNHGSCMAPETCTCKGEYSGASCDQYACFGVRQDAANVCSGAGICRAPNSCECVSSFRIGEDCWFDVGPSLIIGGVMIFALLCLCLWSIVGVSGIAFFRFVKRLRNVEREKKMTQQLLEGFVKDEEMDLVDADSQRARLIVQKSMLEIDFSELSHLEKIASGGSGAILFRAEWNGSKVAVKVFKSGLMTGETFFQEFEHEVSLMSTLRHRNIINFYGCSLAFPRIAIVMELCEAGSVETLIENGDLKSKSAHELLQMLLDIAEGVLYLHSREVIHRDLKCANVLVDEHSVCKLSDFGLSKYTKDNIERMHTVGIGTSYYMAPEIAKGTGEYTENVDVYAFGILAMEILLGRLCPFPGATQSNVMEVQQRALLESDYRPDVNELDQRFSFLHWMLKSCWNADPAIRPPARDIAKILKSSLYDTSES